MQTQIDLPELLIDGRPKHPHEVILIHQTNPFPGGHSFQWRIPIAFVHPKTLRAANFASARSPDRQRAMGWFWWLSSILGDWNKKFKCCNKDQTMHHFEFVVNTIDEMKVSDKLIEVSGRCSSFVRNHPTADDLL